MESPAPVAISILRVLIVEDEAVIAYALRDCLEVAGVQVVGLAATEATARHLSARERPDAAVVDVMLREGSGLDLARSLVEQGTTVLFATGNAEDSIARCGLQNVAYVSKPYDMRSIGTALRAAGHLRATGTMPEWAPVGMHQLRA
jgi:DNA-binding response OmpR family regulator